jgi:hypothetical protein
MSPGAVRRPWGSCNDPPGGKLQGIQQPGPHTGWTTGHFAVPARNVLSKSDRSHHGAAHLGA